VVTLPPPASQDDEVKAVPPAFQCASRVYLKTLTITVKVFMYTNYLQMSHFYTFESSAFFNIPERDERVQPKRRQCPLLPQFKE
jgi:hypothetical protein